MSRARTALERLETVGTRVSDAAPGRRGIALAGAELLGLSALVIAQPLFDALERSTWAFPTEGVWGFELGLFGAILVFLPPAVMLAIELAIGLISRSLRGWVHLFWLGSLLSLFIWQAVAENGNASRADELLVVAAGLAGLVLYVRFEAARSLLRILSFSGPVVLGIFLLTAPISSFFLASDPDVPEARVDSRTPVVLVVFDEFPVAGLLNAKGKIDAKRFPNFAALAGDSDWFKNALTVSGATEQAVPAILSGDFSKPESLAIYGDHPRNLFTLLAPAYNIHAVDTGTDLCPPGDCSKDSGSLISRYAHLLRTGVETAQSLPMGLPGRITREIDMRYPAANKVDQVQRFLDELGRPGKTGTLDYLHIGLPHVPYQYLPSGHQYYTDGLAPQGTTNEMWSDSPGYAFSGLKRMTLQLQYTDRVLEVMVESLRNHGLYNRSLFVVAADHGAAFFPGHSRRLPDPTSAGAIMRVPLFVKRPGQRRGKVIRWPVETIDLVPTIADVLGIRIPWRVDGESLYQVPARRWTDPSMKRWQRDLGFSAATISKGFQAALAQRNGLVGHGSVYTFGASRRELARQLKGAQPLQVAVQSTGGTYYDPASGIYPSLVYGSIAPAVQDGTFLIAKMNGRIAAVGQAIDGGTRFTVMIPPSAFHPGENRLELYAP